MVPFDKISYARNLRLYYWLFSIPVYSLGGVDTSVATSTVEAFRGHRLLLLLSTPPYFNPTQVCRIHS